MFSVDDGSLKTICMTTRYCIPEYHDLHQDQWHSYLLRGARVEYHDLHQDQWHSYLLRGARVLAELYVRFRNNKFLQGGVVSPTPNPPTWRTRVSLLVWHLPRNLSGMGGRTSSYAATA
jgi:hypothetical protein